jgi:elongation factor G
MKAVYFDGEKGETIRIEEIPEGLEELAAAKRVELLDAASMFSDELMEALLEEKEVGRDLVLRRPAKRPS